MFAPGRLRPSCIHCFCKTALTFNSDAGSTVRSCFHDAKPARVYTTVCAPVVTVISEGVLPTYLPSREISAPGGVVENVHLTVSALFSCPKRGPRAEETGCAETPVLGGAAEEVELDAAAVFAWESVAAAAVGGAGVVSTRWKNYLLSRPWESSYTIVRPPFSLRASNVSPTAKAEHLDHRESTVQDMV